MLEGLMGVVLELAVDSRDGDAILLSLSEGTTSTFCSCDG